MGRGFLERLRATPDALGPGPEPWARPEGEEVRAGLRRISGGDRRAARERSGAAMEGKNVLAALSLLNTPAHLVSIVNVCPADRTGRRPAA